MLLKTYTFEVIRPPVRRCAVETTKRHARP